MKQILFILIASMNAAFAQQPLSISTEKTTSLIFPFPIKYVDRGTRDILVQPVKEDERILLVKAASKQFAETNLSVVTGDGNVYEFTVNYTPQPSVLVLHLPPNKKATISAYASAILNNPPRRISKVEHGAVITKLSGIYIKDDVIYYQLEIHNHSPLDFDIELLKFFITDKKRSKRSSVQENELVPLYVAGNRSKVKAYNFSVVVVALDKFTIPDAKFLRIQLMEKNGGRHFNLKVYNGQILKARMLPELN
ncbi:MAG TPA: conjugative transposon protein TraN [Chitinophagaceae bacterium]|nr:conjugative transposon protein TraN [Chitinophagaceae bacterium]